MVALAGWVNQQQRDVIHYLVEENRVLCEQIGARRLRFTDDQRRRLAAKALTLGRRLLHETTDGLMDTRGGSLWLADSWSRPTLPVSFTYMWTHRHVTKRTT